QTERLTHLAYKSIRERLGAFADHVPVFPTHGAGSFCSAPGGTERTTTIEREHASNPVFTTPDEDRFVRTFLAGLGTYPPYFLRTREVNRRGPEIFGGHPPLLSPLDARDVRRLVREGAVVIDARSFEAFAHGRIAGSYAIELGGIERTELPDGPLTLYCGHGQRGMTAASLLERAGRTDLGVLRGGPEDWTAATGEALQM